jgi:hypothetical protein
MIAAGTRSAPADTLTLTRVALKVVPRRIGVVFFRKWKLLATMPQAIRVCVSATASRLWSAPSGISAMRSAKKLSSSRNSSCTWPCPIRMVQARDVVAMIAKARLSRRRMETDASHCGPNSSRIAGCAASARNPKKGQATAVTSCMPPTNCLATASTSRSRAKAGRATATTAASTPLR